jgi:hypothetical protein
MGDVRPARRFDVIDGRSEMWMWIWMLGGRERVREERRDLRILTSGRDVGQCLGWEIVG